MSAPVFLSYARSASCGHAQALQSVLGESAFLDTTDLDLGEPIPAGLANALLGAKVMVVFAEPAYFGRWYCLRELNVALAAFNALVRRGRPEADRVDAVHP